MKNVVIIMSLLAASLGRARGAFVSRGSLAGTLFWRRIHLSRCLFSSQPLVMASSSNNFEQEERESLLLDPSILMNGTIPYPKSLSPSSIMEFKACPQSYLFQYLWGLKQPKNLALAKGSMCHAALEQVFDLEPQERTLDHLQNLFRSSWAKHRLDDEYQDLFMDAENGEWNQQAEQTWGREGLELLKNYVHLEDPREVERPNPIQREIWVSKKLSLNPRDGVTGYVAAANNNGNGDKEEDTANTQADASNNSSNSSEQSDDSFLVRGIIDRLDMIRLSKSDVALRIVDYKTGKAPNFKYSPAFNEQMAEEAFYQLKIYALLLRERGAKLPNGLDLKMLRLLYLTSENGNGLYLDMNLGDSQEERDGLLQEMHVDLANVWTTIRNLVDGQDPKAFVHCDRPFCYCHTCRERFLPGTVYEATAASTSAGEAPF